MKQGHTRGRISSMNQDWRNEVKSKFKKVTMEYARDLADKSKIPNVKHLFFNARRYGRYCLDREFRGVYKRIEVEYDEIAGMWTLHYYGRKVNECGTYEGKKIFEYNLYMPI